MRFTSTFHIEAPPSAVIAMLANPEYAEQRAQGGRPTNWQSLVDGAPPKSFTVRIRRRMSTEMVPATFRRFVGETVDIVQTENWDGTDAAAFTIEVANLPVRANGRITLRPDGKGTNLTTTGDVVAAIPLVGGRVEQAIVDALDTVSGEEARIAAAWLEAHPR